jgi:transposase-like protein
MIHTEIIHCPYCSCNDLAKNGKDITGKQRWLCNTCRKTFYRIYTYKACVVGVKEQVIDMTLNGSGVRDIGRVLGINKNTVCSILSQKKRRK